MAERKDTNPFHSEESAPHLPPSVYQPNPFPLNPAEGNPWASTSNDKPYQQPPPQGHVNAYDNSSSSYGHSYNNTSSDGGSQSNYSTYTMQMPMPTPSVNAYNTTNSSSYSYSNSTYPYDYNNPYNAYSVNTYNSNTYNPNVNAYSNNNDNNNNNPNVTAYESSNHTGVNAYEPSNNHLDVNQNDKSEQENTYDDHTAELDDSVAASNPGIETHDPDKLKVSSGMIKASLSGVPNKWRFLSRFIQFFASAGALGFIIGAPLASNQETPQEVKTVPIVFLYIVSILSIIYSFGHLIFYCLRRWRHKNKAPRWSLLIIDAVIGASFGTLMVFLIKDSRCSPGGHNGWCDFYNTAIFFTVLSFVTYAVSFIWDIVGGIKT